MNHLYVKAPISLCLSFFALCAAAKNPKSVASSNQTSAIANESSEPSKRKLAGVGPCGLTGPQFVDVAQQVQSVSFTHVTSGAIDAFASMFASDPEHIFKMGHCARIGVFIAVSKQAKNFAKVAEPGVYSPTQIEFIDQVYGLASSLKDTCDFDLDVQSASLSGVRKYGLPAMYITDVLRKIKVLQLGSAAAFLDMPDTRAVPGCVISEVSLASFVEDMRKIQVPYRLLSLKSAVEKDKLKSKATASREFLSTCMEVHRSDTLMTFLAVLRTAKGNDFVGFPQLDQMRQYLGSMTAFCDGAVTKAGARIDEKALDRDLAALVKLSALK